MKQAIIFSLSLFSFFAVKAQLRPGDVSPTAKVIDADKLGHFNKGAAIITKGNLTALIDTAGNFIIPYGEYELSYGFDTRGGEYLEEYQTGLFIAKKKMPDFSTQVSYINSKGKVIYDQKTFLREGYKSKQSPAYKYSYHLTKDCKYIEITSEHYVDPTYYIDSEGKRYQVSERFAARDYTVSDGIGIISRSVEGMGFRYLTLENKLLPDTYTTAESFRNGYAVVGKKDQFGNEKFGYINTKGEVVIPLQFSRKPESFSGGAAKVYPQNTTEFGYAFINNTGEVIYKNTQANQAKFINDYLNVFYGNICISSRGGAILSLKGYLAPLEENIKGFKLDATGNKNILKVTGFSFYKWANNYRSNILVYNKQERVQSREENTRGFINLNNGKIIDAPFVQSGADNYSPELIFDPVSQLAYAKLYKTYSASNRKWEFTEGYINRDGVFVMVVKNETSVW